jgi:DNA recombination protein RmuC
METALAAIMALLMFAGGVAAGCLLMRGAARQARAAAQAEVAAERATLLERLATREAEARAGRSELESLAAEVRQLQEQMRDAAVRCSAAEEKNARIPELEAALKERDERIAALLDETRTFAAQVAELGTKLDEERKAGEAKLALLNEAQQKLSDAFKALAAEALKSNKPVLSSNWLARSWRNSRERQKRVGTASESDRRVGQTAEGLAGKS